MGKAYECFAMLGGAVGIVEEKLNRISDPQFHEYDVFIDAVIAAAQGFTPLGPPHTPHSAEHSANGTPEPAILPKEELNSTCPRSADGQFNDDRASGYKLTWEEAQAKLLFTRFARWIERGRSVLNFCARDRNSRPVGSIANPVVMCALHGASA